MAQENLVVCGKCAGVNRLPAARPVLEAKCGKCHQKLFSGHPENVDGNNFSRQLERNTMPVLVDVWAPWCGPCRVMGPAFEEASRELEPKLRLVKLDSDAEPKAASGLGIRSIPTMILFDRGREIARTSGAMTASGIVNWCRANVPAASA